MGPPRRIDTHCAMSERSYDRATSRSAYVYNVIARNIGFSFLLSFFKIGSILRGGPIELFLVPASAPRMVQQRPWYVLSCLWDSAYKRTLAANRNERPVWEAAGFLSRYLNGPLPYV